MRLAPLVPRGHEGRVIGRRPARVEEVERAAHRAGDGLGRVALDDRRPGEAGPLLVPVALPARRRVPACGDGRQERLRRNAPCERSPIGAPRGRERRKVLPVRPLPLGTPDVGGERVEPRALEQRRVARLVHVPDQVEPGQTGLARPGPQRPQRLGEFVAERRAQTPRMKEREERPAFDPQRVRVREIRAQVIEEREQIGCREGKVPVCALRGRGLIHAHRQREARPDGAPHDAEAKARRKRARRQRWHHGLIEDLLIERRAVGAPPEIEDEAVEARRGGRARLAHEGRGPCIIGIAPERDVGLLVAFEPRQRIAHEVPFEPAARGPMIGRIVIRI